VAEVRRPRCVKHVHPQGQLDPGPNFARTQQTDPAQDYVL